MVSFLQGVRNAVSAVQCAILSADAYVVGAVGAVAPSVRDGFLQGINANRRLLGCDPVDDPQQPSPPFSGGQCAGVGYTVQVAGTANPPGGPGVATRSGLGPVGGMCFPNAGFGNVSIGVQFAGGCATSGAGQALTVPAVQGSWQIVLVTRDDGLPDDCGSVPPVYPPATEFNTDIDVTYNIDDGTEITVTIPFIFAPITTNFNGTLRIPFTLDLGGFEFSGSIDLPDLDVTINPPSVPPGSGEDLTPVGDDEPGETVPPADPDQKIIGVVVQCAIAQPGQVGSIDFGDGPDIIVPRAASVKFGYSIAGRTFWSSDIDVKTLRAFIACPFSQGADTVLVEPYIGLVANSVPVRGYPLATAYDVSNAS